MHKWTTETLNYPTAKVTNMRCCTNYQVLLGLLLGIVRILPIGPN